MRLSANRTADRRGLVTLREFIVAMPKVELHVHLEGAIGPDTLLALAKRNHVALPVTTRTELERWYRFRSFQHFIEIYLAISKCIRTVADIELVTREFLIGQAEQRVLHSEVTYTADRHYRSHGLSFRDQLAAINRARRWAEENLGVTMTLTIDYARELSAEGCLRTAEWAIAARDEGVSALGLGGPEVGNPPERFRAAFDRAHAAGLPCVPHAGETEGPASIRGALDALHAVRIGHGVRCVEDPRLVDRLRQQQIPLEVCPTSNICLNVFTNMAAHALPVLLDEGLYVTLNSDDPAMFNTTLTAEYLAAAETFDLSVDDIERLVLNAARASLLPEIARDRLLQRMAAELAALRSRTGTGGAEA